ncbi:MAG: bis(5'-nucleosyl)-tetraphosphatase (symmetrical) YqeK [Acholeplasmatales bacterium]|jgi:nicotinate-nucleotide adenylyltransferase|nr:bis(5'-nucleosyl)-tetraphosphatase (symmetrical) YqeK [Acholeplasmatales bacterium]
MRYSYRFLKKWVKKILVDFHHDPLRYQHLLNVQELGVKLARKYGASIYKVKTACLLHDITKDESLEFHKYYTDPLDFAQYQHSIGILHSFSGANFIKSKFKIKDQTILYAIKAHTIGSTDHNLTSMILYVSDIGEKSRSYSDALQIRNTALNVGLNEAVLMAINLKTNYLIKNGKTPTKNSLDSLEYFKNIVNNDPNNII